MVGPNLTFPKSLEEEGVLFHLTAFNFHTETKPILSVWVEKTSEQNETARKPLNTNTDTSFITMSIRYTLDTVDIDHMLHVRCCLLSNSSCISGKDPVRQPAKAPLGAAIRCLKQTPYVRTDDTSTFFRNTKDKNLVQCEYFFLFHISGAECTMTSLLK